MNDYIKREDALDSIEKYEPTYKFNMSEREQGYNNGLEISACAISNLPSADVVEVVRCKDCEFWNKDENVLNNRGICDEWSDYEGGISRYTGSDDYCSYGERKEK